MELTAEEKRLKDLYPLPFEEKEGLWDNWQPK